MNKFIIRLSFIACMAASIGLFTGCGEQTDTTNTSVVSKTDTAAKPAGQPNMADMGFTLPVLDALFYEDSFAAQLKTELQLTDEQIGQLKEVARSSVSDLSEDGDYAGSARTANTHTREEIQKIVGPEKTDQLFQLIARRYSSGDLDGLMPTTPNAVPTDTRIVINAPAFRVDVFQEGKLLKTYRVGIGYPEFPLPTGMRRAEQIIFNPTWTPPDEPWVKGKFAPGQKVAAGSKDNPLGPIKIPIGLPSLIHGGKAVAKLGNFASHGCVGMTNEQVQEFTALLSQIGGTPLTNDSILGFARKKTQTKSVKLGTPVPVELRYETIVAENGKLYVYRDVYERGTNTLENAKRILEVHGVKYERLNEQEKMALTQALDEMDRDPAGKRIAGVDSTQGADTSSATGKDESKDGVAASKVDRAKKGKETRTVKGRKEVIVPIAALNGKGYPAPVDLNAGTKPRETAKNK